VHILVQEVNRVVFMRLASVRVRRVLQADFLTKERPCEPWLGMPQRILDTEYHFVFVILFGLWTSGL
jgi:hypothetical protein